MREYEVTIVVQPQLDENARAQVIERVQGWLATSDDEADNPVVHHWGKRTLAYPIKKHTEGYYVLFEAKLDPVKVNEIERNILYVEDILRHLIVRKDS